jgi:sigma-B regulation protein RsbU (phosphoserine phosphatase)
VERLTATSTVLGLFETWECDVAEVQLAPEDILVMYTDGVTEATDGNEEEFGEGRLLKILNEQLDFSAPALLQAVIEGVQQFRDGEQADDITLLVARCRG